MEIFELLGRVVVETGASKGMGFAIARTLGATGAMVIVSARTNDAAANAAALLQTEGVEVRGLALDVTEQQSAAEFSANALAAFGRIDVLVLNAAANTPTAPCCPNIPTNWARSCAITCRRTWPS
jgi:NAD(P)-dependent dehydrogenase (short-subunit alcohol dehydrogenase family)